MTKQVNLWNTKSPMRHLSLKCLMIMPNLLLQQTSYKSTASENKKTLDRRLSLWKDQKISEILGECLVIQSRLNKPRTSFAQDGISQSFHKLMIQGKVNAAIRLLSHSENSGILPLNEETMQELQIKHPESRPKYDDMILQGPVEGSRVYKWCWWDLFIGLNRMEKNPW